MSAYLYAGVSLTYTVIFSVDSPDHQVEEASEYFKLGF
jgi:hypothetical protein